MNSVIFKVGARLLVGILLILSVIVFWRGHQLPGGGFVGGLIASCGIAIQALCFGSQSARKLLLVESKSIMLSGLVAALLAALWGPFVGQSFFKGLWTEVPILGAVGTPVLFDLGVYLVVIGVMGSILLSLMEKEEAA